MTHRDHTTVLHALTRPRSVAIIGASGTAGRVTARPVALLKKHGFSGTILPVNPNRSEIMGLPAFASVDALPTPVDHAYVLLDADPAIAAVEACARAGVPVVSVLADGFAEAGPDGQRRQDRITAIAREAGILLIGPNSMGVVDTRSRFVCTTNAAFATDALPSGRFAVISQSGSVIGTIASRGAARGLGFSTLISVGNEAANGVGELGRLLIEDEGCDGLVLFMETLRNPEAIASMSREAHRRGKPVVAYVIGRSSEGQALSVSHTGAMLGGSRAIEAFLKHHGIVRVDTFEALIEAPQALKLAPRLAGRPRTATVVATTGGGGAMVIDQLSARGAAIAGCSPAAVDALAHFGLPIGRSKLVDVTLAGARYDVMRPVVEALANDPETGLIVVAIGSSAQFNPELAVSPIIDAVAAGGPGAAPVLAFPLPDARESLGLLANGGISSFRTLESCAETVATLLAGCAPEQEGHAERDPIVVEALHVTDAADATLSEVEAGRVLARLGLPAPRSVVVPVDGRLPHALPLTFPVAVKVVSRDLIHKSDVGGVALGIGDIGALAATINQLREAVSRGAPDARVDGFLVQEMASGVGEAIVGFTRDPLVGPVVTVGVGGVDAEIYADVAVRPAPVSPEVAMRMLDEVRGFRKLKGWRGKPAGDLTALAQAVVSVSRLAAYGEVAEAEVNPIIVREDGAGVAAVDALVRLAGEGRGHGT